MKKLTALLLVATAFGLLGGGDSCFASIVFDNGDNTETGRWSSAFPPVNHVADDFLLSTDTTITDVHWKGLYGAGAATGADDFSIRIYADSGSGQPTTPVPGSALYSDAVGGANRTATSELLFGFYTVYSYSAVISPFVAIGGTNYWLEIFNNATNDVWYWSMDVAGNSVSTEFGSAWITTGGETTFQLTNDGAGTVPEPASVIAWSVLIGLGLGIKRMLPGCFQRT